MCVCMYVCIMYICMYVCVCVCVYIYIYMDKRESSNNISLLNIEAACSTETCYVPIKRHGTHTSEDSNLHDKSQLELSVEVRNC